MLFVTASACVPNFSMATGSLCAPPALESMDTSSRLDTGSQHALFCSKLSHSAIYNSNIQNWIACRRLSHVCSNRFRLLGLRGNVQGFAQITCNIGQYNHRAMSRKHNIPRLQYTPRNRLQSRRDSTLRDSSLDITTQPPGLTAVITVSSALTSDVLQFQRGTQSAIPKPDL